METRYYLYNTIVFFFANKYFDYLQEQKELTATELNFIERPITKNTY